VPHRYVPETGTLTTITTFNEIPNTTSFGGLYASRDGTRMWSWTNCDEDPENYDGLDPGAKPFVYIDNSNYASPRIRYAYFWGHGNVMLPDGSLSLATGWNHDNNTHPYLWTWNWDTFTQGTTYEPGLTEVGELVQVANNSEWIGLSRGRYLYNFATPGATVQPITNPKSGWGIEQFWFGDFTGQTPWYITTPTIILDSSTTSGTVSITGWTDAGSPTVQDDAAWLPAPVVTRNGATVSLQYTVTNPPATTDTATVSVTDGAQVTRTCKAVWKVSVPLNEQLQVQTVVDSVSVRFTWTNTLGAGYSFRMQEFNGATWGARTVVTTSYVDNNPVEGDNRYRLAAIHGTDTLYAELTAYYSAPASLTILTPVDGQQVAGGAQLTLTWSAAKVETVVPEISVDGGETWSMLVTEAIHPADPEWSDFPLSIPSGGAQTILLWIHPYQQTAPADMVTLTVSGSSVTPQSAHRSLRPGGQGGVRVAYDLQGRRVAAVPMPSASAVCVVRERLAAHARLEMALRECFQGELRSEESVRGAR